MAAWTSCTVRVSVWKWSALTREQRFDIPSGELRVGLRFRPGMARRFLRLAADELCDRTVPLESLMGAGVRELQARLDATGSAAECRSVLGQALNDGGDAPDPVQLAIEAMTQSHGEVDVDWVADQAGMSARQFRRRCREESGLGPKHLARVLRFRRACELASRGESWLRVAAEAGYFDQAHLIRDFHEFANGTPMSVFSKTEIRHSR
jgi:AraC-like DNA-binding protein